MTAPGLRSRFARQLGELNDQVLELGVHSRRAVAQAMKALEEQNGDLAQEVISRDTEINRRRYEIEKQCYAVMATEQPVAGDLRTVVAALIVAMEMERIGDHGKKIASTYLRMQEEPRQLPPGHIIRLADAALGLFDRSLRVYAERDSEEAAAVCRADDQVDALYKQSFNILLEYMIEDPRLIGAATHLVQVAHELERVGDRATNIAERVIYSVTGEFRDLNT